MNVILLLLLICWYDTLRILFCSQIQNADDVLISPLERFRKEQIGAVKVYQETNQEINMLKAV